MATAPNYNLCSFSSGAAPMEASLQVWARLFEMQMNMTTAWFDAAMRLNPFLPAVDTEQLSMPHAAPAPAPKAKTTPKPKAKPKAAAKPKAGATTSAAAAEGKAAPAAEKTAAKPAAKPRATRAKTASRGAAKPAPRRRRTPAKPAQPFKTED